MNFLKRTHILGGLIGLFIGVVALPLLAILFISDAGVWGLIIMVLLLDAIPNFGLPPIVPVAICSFALGWTLAFVRARYKEPSKEKRIVTTILTIVVVPFCFYIGYEIFSFIAAGPV